MSLTAINVGALLDGGIQHSSDVLTVVGSLVDQQ
jgi:hypothetical protein